MTPELRGRMVRFITLSVITVLMDIAFVGYLIYFITISPSLLASIIGPIITLALITPWNVDIFTRLRGVLKEYKEDKKLNS